MDAFDKFLSEEEKTLIASFYSNEKQREAVKKILLFGVYYNGILKKDEEANPLMNWALSLAMGKGDVSNEALGADLRASAEGIRAIENAYLQLKSFVKEKEIPKKENPAR